MSENVQAAFVKRNKRENNPVQKVSFGWQKVYNHVAKCFDLFSNIDISDCDYLCDVGEDWKEYR